MIAGYNAGTFDRSCKIACVNGVDVDEAKAFGHLLYLKNAGIRQIHICMPIDREIFIAVHLPVSHEINPIKPLHIVES